MDDAQLRKEMEGLSFYHTIRLTPTLSTPGWPVVVPIVEMTRGVLNRIDLRGKRVLDIGCRDGLFCFEAEKLGAAEVVGIDNDFFPGVTEFLSRVLRSRTKFHPMNLFDLKPESFGLFDVVIFPGVLYHLRYPFWALKLIRDVMVDDGLLVLETAVLADDNRLPLMFCPRGDDSPYEPTSCTFFNRRGLHDTLVSIGLRPDATECLLKLNGNLAAVASPNKTPIDRCSVLCTKRAGLDDDNLYWEGKPNNETQLTWDKKRKSA